MQPPLRKDPAMSAQNATRHRHTPSHAGRRLGLGLAVLLLHGLAAPASGLADTRTLTDALAAAYSTNPTLLGARAQLRATDEGVSQALAGWRPTIALSGGPGYGDGSVRSANAGGTNYSRINRDIMNQQATLIQPIFAGGATGANTRAADNRVYAQRARLLATEQQVFTDVVNAFVTVIQTQQTLQLNLNNELVLTRQLEATRERDRIGENTLTDVRRQTVQQAAQTWETLVANRLQIDSTRAQIRANQVALEGTQREAILGSRTTLDVLNAQQLLLNSRVTLVQNLASLVTASYAVAAAIGRLTARDLRLGVPLYDETAYYNAVRQRLAGTGDYATNQPGR